MKTTEVTHVTSSCLLLIISLFNSTTDIETADRLEHDQKVASGNQLHDQRAVFVLHDHPQQLDHPLMIQARHDAPLSKKQPFTLPAK